MRFVKHNYFRIGEKRFRINTGMVYLPEADNYENQVGNAVEYEELAMDKDFTETVWRNTGIIVTELKTKLYEMINQGNLILE